jgi:acyl-coenzyme A thioesterase PaaI-like protein
VSTPDDQPVPHGPEGLVAPAYPTPTRRAEPPEGFTGMIDALRDLQDRVTAAVPPADLVADATKAFTELAARLEAHAVPERAQLTGRLVDVPGRAQVMSPTLYLDEHDAQQARGRVTYGRYYLGGNGAVHGGAIPLLFDELMGRLANTERPVARTAYLNVDFRSIAPMEQELRVAARFVHEEGRKRLLRGTLHHGDRLCAEAEGLFVQLRPGQP